MSATATNAAHATMARAASSHGNTAERRHDRATALRHHASFEKASYGEVRAMRTRRGTTRAQTTVTASTSTATEPTTRMVNIDEMVGEVFPSNLRCALRVNVPLDESKDAVEAGRSLSTYMRLPVDQYVGIELPMGAEMKRVPNDPDLFQLEIPGLKFLSLEVKPVVRVRVRLVGDGEHVSTWTGQSGFPGGKTPEWRAAELKEIERMTEELNDLKKVCEDDDVAIVPEECDAIDPVNASKDDDDALELSKSYIPQPTPMGRPEREDVVLTGPCVLIEAISCRVEGEVVEELGVNDLFVFRGTTCFRWNSDGDDTLDAELQRTGPGGEDESDPAVSGHANARVVGKKKPKQACISGWADIGVGVDPPGPFALLPKKVTEKVGDAVMRTTLKALQTVFLKGLGEDYKKWATDEEYRAAREIAAAEAAKAANL